MSDTPDTAGAPDTANAVDTADTPTAEGAPDAAQAGAEGDDEGGEDEAAPEGGAAGEASPTGDPTKRKRRRRRKKKGATTANGEPSPAGAETAPQQQRHSRRDGPPLAFARFFEGPVALGGRRHSFGNGEVVAGRVLKTEHGVITVDLFGKAVALIDDREPRTLPTQPVAHPPAVVLADASADDPAAPPSADTTAEPGVDVAHDEALPSTAGAEAAVAAEAAAAAAADEAAEQEAAAAAAADEAAEHEAREPEPPHLEPDLEPEGPPPEPPKVGSVFRARVAGVAESGHLVLANRIVDSQAARARIERFREAHRRVSGVVYGFNRGGFDVFVEGMRAFCPATGMSLTFIESPDEYVGQRLEFSLPPMKPGAHGIIVSRRSILERELKKRAKERLRNLKVGERVRGYVTQVREFGLFIDFGGIEGMVHVSELSWDRSVRPEDAARVGDEVEAEVIKVPDGREKKDKKDRFERVGLSMKSLAKDPWDDHADVLAEGTVQHGKVTRVAEFGAFVELVPGIDGLLHVSELGKDLRHAGDAINVGDEVDVVIERVDKGQRRIALSKLSAAEAKALAEGSLAGAQKPKVIRPGQSISVVVDHVEHHGVFVQIAGIVGRRGRGYISNADMATERGTDHRRLFPPGTKLEVKVVGSDRDGGLKCSRKAFLNDEEKKAVTDYRREASKQGFGTFGDLLRAKLGQGGPK